MRSITAMLALLSVKGGGRRTDQAVSISLVRTFRHILAFMSGERSMITFPGRQTIESKKPIMSFKEYNNTIDRLNKENEEFKDQIADFRKVLTQHKHTIEESATVAVFFLVSR